MMLEILIGPIASGKSTYCGQRAKDGAIIINDDAIVTMIHGGHYELYSKELKPLYKIVENTILQTAIHMGRDVIIDRPNYSRSMRRRYIGLAKSLDTQVIAILFERSDPLTHAHRRFKSDPRSNTLEHWIEAANRHESLFEIPSLEEGFDDIIQLK